MLEVNIDNIIPVTEARDSFNQLIDKVEGSDEMYVLTKNGKPSAILVGVHHLEKLTGTSHEELMGGSGETLTETPLTTNATADAGPSPAAQAEPFATAASTPTVENPTETPVEPAINPEPPTSPSQTALDSADSMQNLQDSPFAYNNTQDQTSPVSSTSSTSPDAAYDTASPAGQEDTTAPEPAVSPAEPVTPTIPVAPADDSATTTPPPSVSPTNQPQNDVPTDMA